MSVAPGLDNQRRNPRHPTSGLTCHLGEVLDVSRGGMRILCRGKLPVQKGQTGSLRLALHEGELSVNGRIVWTRRTGLRKHQIGIEFIEVSLGVANALEAIAKFGLLPDGFRQSIDRREGDGRGALCASFSVPDYYQVLGVAGDATSEEIHKAYRSLARRHHPDLSEDPGSERDFVQIAQAYDILKDPARRALYDLKQAC